MEMSMLLNELVANDKYGQLVKSGTTVRRAALRPSLSRGCAIAWAGCALRCARR